MLTIKQREQKSNAGGCWLGPAPWIETPPPGPKARAAIERDRRVTAIECDRRQPLVAHRAHGSVIEDVDGNRYLDFAVGLATCAAGHTHQRVVSAIARQSERLIHLSGSDFYDEPRTQLAERLGGMAPGDGPKHVLLTGGRNEAVEAAVKMARKATHRPWLVAFTGCAHGWTIGAMTLTMAKSHPRHGFGPLVPKIAHLPYGESADLDRSLRHKGIKPTDIAAFFVKPMNATDGFVLPPASFLADLRSFCEAHGALLVVDEVLTGMGRTGYMFACEHFGVVPDMIVLGESLGSGMPLGAVIADARLAGPVALDLAAMINGSPVSCAAAQATLDLLSGYMANAWHVGQQLRDELERLATRHRCLANVRGLGMMSALDIVKGAGTASPKLRDRILRNAFERGLLLLACGHSGIQFSPPLCLNQTQLDVAMHVFGECVQTVT